MANKKFTEHGGINKMKKHWFWNSYFINKLSSAISNFSSFLWRKQYSKRRSQ